jgi:hypothetical protein
MVFKVHAAVSKKSRLFSPSKKEIFKIRAQGNVSICNDAVKWPPLEPLPGAGLPDGLFFKPKIPIWVHFGGPWNGKCVYIL